MVQKQKVSRTKATKKEVNGYLKVVVFDMKGKEVGEVDLPEEIFGVKENKTLVAQAVRVHLANQATGRGKTKTRAEVAGGGAKPWKQKGTGRARAGSIRSPLWRGGGIVHGPSGLVTRLEMPKKMKRKALLAALSTKARDAEVTVLSKLDLPTAKTKLANEVISKLPLKERIFVVAEINQDLNRSFKNLAGVDLVDFKNINTYEVVSHGSLLFTKESLEKLKEYLTKNGE